MEDTPGNVLLHREGLHETTDGTAGDAICHAGTGQHRNVVSRDNIVGKRSCARTFTVVC